MNVLKEGLNGTRRFPNKFLTWQLPRDPQVADASSHCPEDQWDVSIMSSSQSQASITCIPVSTNWPGCWLSLTKKSPSYLRSCSASLLMVWRSKLITEDSIKWQIVGILRIDNECNQGTNEIPGYWAVEPFLFCQNGSLCHHLAGLLRGRHR